MIKTVMFAKPSSRDSCGRSGFLQTHGVEIYDTDDSVLLHPINSRGKVSEGCRVSISKSALPELIGALHAILTEGAS